MKKLWKTYQILNKKSNKLEEISGFVTMNKTSYKVINLKKGIRYIIPKQIVQ